MTSGKRNHDVVENPRACSGSIKKELDKPRPVWHD